MELQEFNKMDRENTGKALGKIGSGLYVITYNKDGNPGGFTASFLVQVSFEPPLIAFSTKKGRKSFDAIMETGTFCVNVMTKETMKLVGHFAKPRPEGESEFEGVNYEERNSTLPVLNDSLAYLECTVHSTTEAGDHTIVLGEVVHGEVLREGEPVFHVRKNGFSY